LNKKGLTPALSKERGLAGTANSKTIKTDNLSTMTKPPLLGRGRGRPSFNLYATNLYLPLSYPVALAHAACHR
jgi:hypothetical protein